MSGLPEQMRRVAYDAPGAAEVMQLQTVSVPQPAPGQVLIRVVAAGINRPDIAQRQGNYPPPPGASPILGLEVAGTVAGLGPGVANFKLGDPVCALANGGGYAEYCCVPAGQCLPAPKGVPLADTAAIPETYFTVWANLFRGDRLRAGQWLLVHGGSSGIGSTAIQLAKARGAQVIATAGSAEKCSFCTKLGADHAIDYRESDFVADIKAFREGNGVDVILDMVGGDYVAKNLRCLAVEGTLVQIAFQQGSKVELDLMPLMLKRQTITGSTMRARSDVQKAIIAADLLSSVWPLFEAAKLKLPITARYPLDEVVEAHKRMESSAHFGKIVLDVAAL